MDIKSAKWRSQGGNDGNSPTENKKLLKKNDIISEGSIFSNIFSKNSLQVNFYIEFSSKISKFLKNSLQIMFCLQTREKETHGFVKFCVK